MKKLLNTLLFYENSSMIQEKMRKRALQLQKLVFLEKYTIRAGFWNGQSGIMQCRLMRKR